MPLPPKAMLDWALQSALFEVADVLCFSFDLELCDFAAAPDWFHVSDAECKAFATDATGGAYAVATLRPDNRRYGIHADPRGKAAVLGTSVQETVAMVIALPYWRDLLKLTDTGELAQMRRLAESLEAEVQDDIPAIDEARVELWKLLPRHPRPLGSEHESRTRPEGGWKLRTPSRHAPRLQLGPRATPSAALAPRQGLGEPHRSPAARRRGAQGHASPGDPRAGLNRERDHPTEGFLGRYVAGGGLQDGRLEGRARGLLARRLQVTCAIYR
jgi:hypothetical protein